MPKPKEDPEPKPKGTWGGRRPGAGAPKGNLNGLKHGKRSRQFNAIGAMIARDPDLRATLFHLAAETAWRDGDHYLAMDITHTETLRPKTRPKKRHD